MLAYFPSIYKDELIYSLLSRYHYRSGNDNGRNSIKDIFGVNKLYIIPDLTSNIGDLTYKLSHFTEVDIDKWISNHTLYNYYTNFISSEIKLLVKQYMIDGSGENKIHYLTGQVATTIKEPIFFRYCPDCIRLDIKSYGETYWRTYHQLPSVFVCLEHECLLKDSLINIRQDITKFDLPSIEKSSIDTHENNEILNLNFDLVYKMATESYRITNQNYEFDLVKLLNIYRNILRDKGYMKPSGSINQIKLREDFISFFGIKFLNVMQSIPSGIEGQCWLKAITRKHRKSFHPIRHLLFIQFLGESVDTISDYANMENAPFGQGPYLCLNIVAKHYLNPVITDLKVTTCNDTKRPVGTFTCSCGFVYSRRGPDLIPEDSRKIGRIKAFGAVWLEKLDSLINKETLSYRAIARILNVDTNTIIKYSNKQVREVIVTQTSIKNEEKIEWLAMVRNNPNQSRSELRKKNPSLYMRLYRSDREWLLQHSPNKAKIQSENKRVNWEERDLRILEEVKNAVKEINNSVKPVRITLSKIGRIIKQLPLLERKLKKLPHTEKFILSVTETVEEFQERRIQWAVEQLEKEDLSPWKIRRKAGLKDSFYEKWNGKIENYIDIKLSYTDNKTVMNKRMDSHYN